MSAVVIGIALLVAVLGGAAAVMIPAYLRQRVNWKRSPMGYTYFAVESVDAAVLDEAVTRAFVCLAAFSNFSVETRKKTATSLRIVVQKVDTWVSPLHGGATVAGVTLGTDVYVGKNLAGLAHEIAHACEFVEGGRASQDDAHASWAARGIQRSVDEFERK